MRSTNKVVKYVALALGLILAIFIISVIVKTTLGIFGAFGHFGKNAASSSVTNKEFSQEFNGVTSLDLDYSAGYLEIQRGMFLGSKVIIFRIILPSSKKMTR